MLLDNSGDDLILDLFGNPLFIKPNDTIGFKDVKKKPVSSLVTLINKAKNNLEGSQTIKRDCLTELIRLLRSKKRNDKNNVNIILGDLGKRETELCRYVCEMCPGINFFVKENGGRVKVEGGGERGRRIWEREEEERGGEEGDEEDVFFDFGEPEFDESSGG
ncbi:hypothetical protein TrVE_jg9124 [Triparma verrucosa]|uniref:Uncharacterized protein n=1 Tax=Triparma verrucosa TaxID=1606542 RepID=A0A9W7BE57_9STRA|nr:hypothetical protein TrVE_jg9124 [Triparma verrucosa]